MTDDTATAMAPDTEAPQREREFIFSPSEKEMLMPLMRFLAPQNITGKKEVVINRPQEVAYEKYDGTWEYHEAPELDINTLMDIIQLLADKTGQHFDLANPIVSLRLPGGHRAQVVAGMQNAMKFSMAIRLHQNREFSLDHYDMSHTDKQAIIQAVQNKKTLLISGGTGSGKTSFMNALIKYIPADERLVTIEDVRELKVPHRNWCAFTFANSTREDMGGQKAVNAILNATLRMRPDRILLGEIRKENAFTFASAINTGHAGSMATVHANDPKSALDAVIGRVMMNGDISESAINVLRRQLENDIYGVVQLERRGDKVVAYFQVLQNKE